MRFAKRTILPTKRVTRPRAMSIALTKYCKRTVEVGSGPLDAVGKVIGQSPKTKNTRARIACAVFSDVARSRRRFRLLLFLLCLVGFRRVSR